MCAVHPLEMAVFPGAAPWIKQSLCLRIHQLSEVSSSPLRAWILTGSIPQAASPAVSYVQPFLPYCRVQMKQYAVTVLIDIFIIHLKGTQACQI